MNFEQYVEKETDTIIFKILDIANKQELVEYERGLFKAFYKSEQWSVLEGNRMHSPIPYVQQLIHIARFNGKLATALAINLDLTQNVQFEKEGFFIKKSQKMKACEMLPFKQYHTVVKILKKKGIQTCYGVSTKKALKLYVRLGWEILKETSEADKQFYFIAHNFHKE